MSEATAYRYFPDIVSLVKEALVGLWPSPAEALAPVERSTDPVERVAFATEFLLRRVQAYQGAVRAVMAAAITRPDTAATDRPGIRFGLIDHALLPLRETLAVVAPESFAQLKRDLAVVVSAESLFVLMDLCHLSPDAAIASAVSTASTLTEAALRKLSGTDARDAPPSDVRGPTSGKP
ncbi:MAG: TetR/AcrR family transcriptional regulator [Chloroflexota bacterium]